MKCAQCNRSWSPVLRLQGSTHNYVTTLLVLFHWGPFRFVEKTEKMKRSSLILVINISLLAIITIIGLAVQVAPYFTCSLLGMCATTFMYILSEQWMTHDATEFENRFWTLMACALALTCLFCPDSPIQLSHKEPALAWVIVIVFTFLAHNYDRHLHRLVLRKSTNIRRIKSADFCAENRFNAQEKVIELRKLLSTIDHTWMSSTFLNFFFLLRVLKVERQIITIITEANSDELNLIINNIELALLFYKIKDHKIARRFNRTTVLKLLCVDRVRELAILSKVVLLDSLQKMKLSAHPQSENYVKNILLNTKTDELSELKTLMDSKGDVNSMHKLLYIDIRSSVVQEQILKYIALQAGIQRAHSTIGSRKGRARDLLAWRKILSDVDDTLTCAGGSWPAGMDNSYPKKAIYPGVMGFYRELDLGTVGEDSWDNTTRVGNLAFLSARPHVYKSVSENVSYKKFLDLQTQRGLYTSPTLLAGSLDTGSQFMVKGDFEPLAIKKFENFREYLTIYPEYSCIFVGDNGQGDVRTAEKVLSDEEFGKNLQRVYVHQIQPRHLTYCKQPSLTLKDKRLCYFVTYVAAAIDAYKHKLIRATGLRKIMQEAVQDFVYIPNAAWLPSSSKSNSASIPLGSPTAAAAPSPARGRSPSVGSADGSVAGSVASAGSGSGAVPAAGTNSSVPSSPGTASSSRKHIAGASAKESIPAGSGHTANTLASKEVLSSTSSSIPLLTRSFLGKQQSMYNVKKLKTGALAGEGLSAASMGFCRGGGLVKTFTSAAAEVVKAERKRELRMREINNDLDVGNALLQQLRLEPVAKIEYTCRYSVGTSVSTMFGEGIVTNFRPSDGIYEVLVGWECKEDEMELPVERKSVTSKAPSTASAVGPAVTTGTAEIGIAMAQESEEEVNLMHRASSASNPDHFGSRIYGGIKMYIAGVAIHS